MKFVIKPAKRGILQRNQHRVVLIADNGEPLMTSEGYNNVGDAEALVVLVQRGAAGAAVTKG